MPKYFVSGVDKTSGKASTVELELSDRALAQTIADREHNMIVYRTHRLDWLDQSIDGAALARAVLRLWLVLDALAALVCLINMTRGGLIYGLAVIPSVAIPLSLIAILNGLENIVERAEELR